jgi:hypothetical protein
MQPMQPRASLTFWNARLLLRLTLLHCILSCMLQLQLELLMCSKGCNVAHSH